MSYLFSFQLKRQLGFVGRLNNTHTLPHVQIVQILRYRVHIEVEMKQRECNCPLSWSCKFVRDGNQSERGWACTTHPYTVPARADFSIMTEYTPQIGHCHSVCTLWSPHHPPSSFNELIPTQSQLVVFGGSFQDDLTSPCPLLPQRGHPLCLYLIIITICRLNMELDLESLFGLHVHSCTHWLRPRTPPAPRIWAHIRGRYW